MDRIGGSFPGGPRRQADADEESDATDRAFLSVEDLWHRTTGHMLREKHRKRLKRILWGFAAALIVAFGVGLYVGISAHRTAEELAQEQEAGAQEAQQSELQAERQKILQELWKMETLEKLPTPSTSGR